MSAAQPLPTNSSSRPGRNRRGVISLGLSPNGRGVRGLSSDLIPKILAASALERKSQSQKRMRIVLHTSAPLRALTAASESQRPGVGFRPIRSEDPMAWWKRSKPKHTAADPTLPLIRFEGITKIFKGDADEETRALDNVTVDIERGQYVSISGPSGCGKSTFLSMLALLDAPTK